ncbi:E domain-containing protein [Staphylococcus haemolyticus]|uniref:E domain-containing protein n=1 Tax=Staphylococcus haemolyticus TaxID=1283 RepID=UPI00279610FF|nr:E domain-containing protein [Staphylococcus haemolyticus]
MDDVTKYGPVDGDPIIEKEEIPIGRTREFDTNEQTGSAEEVQGKPGSKNPDTRKVVTNPVDDVKTNGPVDSESSMKKEGIKYDEKGV